MKTFYEIQRSVLANYDKDITKLQDDLKSIEQAKSAINSALDMVYEYKMPFMKKRAFITLKAKYSTGHVTAVNGSTTITGIGTTWTIDMVGQRIVITDNTDGDAIYDIAGFTDTMHLILETPYINTGAVVADYAIYYCVYSLPVDFKTLDTFNSITMSIVDYIDYPQLILDASESSTAPGRVVFLGVTNTPLYNTGTVALTKGSNAVVGTATVWDSSIVGKYIQFGTYGKCFLVSTWTDATNITLSSAYDSDDITAASYQIQPPGIIQVRFHGMPVTAKIVPFSYWPKATPLFADTDIPPTALPDMLLFFGGIWIMAKGGEQTAEAGAKVDFKAELMKLAIIPLTEEQNEIVPEFGGN